MSKAPAPTSHRYKLSLMWNKQDVQLDAVAAVDLSVQALRAKTATDVFFSQHHLRCNMSCLTSF